MQGSKANLFMRDDTFLGVCEGIGEDFGFNPLWLRLAFAVLLLWNPVVVVATYLGLGVIVAATRLAFPNPRAAATHASPLPSEGATEHDAPENDDQAKRELLASAA